ncbi:MAG: hypothetical protein M0R73_09090, partial [Dehalococcoidia bacterium]|nr:hypothetical protein [Dehalococcoidia bacterium]
MSLATAATLLGLLVGPGGDAQPDASALAAPLTAEAASPALASGPLPGLGGLLAPFDDEEDEADVDEREGEGDEADEARADRSRPFDRGSRDRGDGRRGPVPGVGRAEDALDICRRGLLGRLLLGPCDDGRNRQEQATPEPPPETPPAEPTSPPTTTPTATPTDAPTPDSTPTGTPTPSSTPSPTPTSPPTGTPTGTPAPGTTSPG